MKDIDPSFKPVAKYLLSTDTKRHNKFCPCCRTLDENDNQMQMAEFLEYIKTVHMKLTGNKIGKKGKAKDQQLEFDSISEVTDLSEEGILTTSVKKLSVPERQRLRRYVIELRKKNQGEVRKHDCGAGTGKPKHRKFDNKRHVCEMELRGKVEPPEVKDEEFSAHQFSQRSISLQADSEEREEIDLQTDLIDIKNDNMN